ncbi:hydantoinase/oxoprolinase family protein [Mesorhizobium ciceri]|uniref:hydantoinase/oxoprolinase family protein n=1 Tax=Mesorhizobium TaxID=68287 RepID=UPI0004B4C520|nr:hydantoinase/oxoprolinase family protein [Mesorhizobium ciceri]
MWKVGVDVGGTFTDLFAVNISTGEERTGKVLTTPEERSKGVLNAIANADLTPDEISLLVHGTTTATNALIERSFPDAAMITTEGFRDVLEIGRMHREHLYRPYQTKPAPLIRRRYRYTIDERTNAKGEVEKCVDAAQLEPIIASISEARIGSVAVCLINSYANPANERKVAEILSDALPNIRVTASADVKPVFREHTRFTLASIRATILPVMANYFERLQARLLEGGFSGNLMILKSNGGMMGVDQARLRVEELVESGPAGGVGYAAEIARTAGFPNIIHTDMGGTSFDASIIEDGQGLITREYELEFDMPVAVPMLDIRSIGAGGGSVGWVDSGGSLRVGPMSAGSVPGPACYGRGGIRPTITDANLVLGRISPDLSGKFKLDVPAARDAVETIATKLDLTIEQCAEGMIRIATEAMAQAVKLVLASRGRDPRDYAFASFGGAGPLHACAVAEALATPTVIVPRYSGVASAYGALRLAIKHDEEVFHYAPLTAEELDRVSVKLQSLGEAAVDALVAQGAKVEDLSVSFVMRMRYAGQTFEVDVVQDRGAIEDRDVQQLASSFHEAHKREFGVRSDDFPVEIVALAVTAEAPSPAGPLESEQNSQLAPSQQKGRKVWFGDWTEALVHDAAGAQIVSGPALIEDPHTSIVIPPGWAARFDSARNCILERA